MINEYIIYTQDDIMEDHIQLILQNNVEEEITWIIHTKCCLNVKSLELNLIAYCYVLYSHKCSRDTE